jgi:hypothetical protein
VQGYRETDPAADEASAGVCIRFRPSKGSSDTSQATPIQDYLDNGFGLTDFYCSRFIMVAAEERQSRKMQRNTVSAVGTLINTVLNAVNAGEDAMTVASGAFTGVDSTYKNIDDAFVITPDKESVIRLVQSAQDAYCKQSRDTPPRSFAEARSKVERYALLCTYDGMRTLVNASIDHAATDLKTENKEGAGPGKQTPPPAGTPLVEQPAPKPTPVTDALIPQ